MPLTDSASSPVEVRARQDLIETRVEVRELRRRIDALERRARDEERKEQERAVRRQWHIIYAINWSFAVLSFVIAVLAIRGSR